VGGLERIDMGTRDKVEAAPRNFGVFLSQVDDGAFIEELSKISDALNDELSRHAQNHSKAKGSLTIVLTFAHDQKGVVEVHTDLKTKAPKATRSKSIFWQNDKGQLVNKNPKQPDLPFRDVNAVDKATRDAIGEGGIGQARAV
jgi:hypothetical protein